MHAPTRPQARPQDRPPARPQDPGGAVIETPAGTPVRRSVLGRLATLGSWALSAALLALVLLTVVVPRLSGATPYVILTGSMRPTIGPGALVVVRPVEVADVRVGDVVTYQLHSGEPTVVTHRVVGVGRTSAGEVVLSTQGDANGSPDAAGVLGPQVRGTVWYSLPWVGRLGALLSPAQHELALRLGALGLLGYSAVVLWRGRRRA